MPSLLTVLLVAAIGGARIVHAAETGSPVSGSDPSSIDSRQLAGAACALGVTQSANSCTCIETIAGESWLTLLRPADCAGCDAARLTTVHLWLRFEYVAYDVPVSIRVVGATGAPGSRVPDLSTEICAAQSYVLSPPGLGLHDFALALPEGCCISTDAFLQVTFPGGIQGVALGTSTVGGCGSYFTDTGQLFNVCSWSCPAGGAFCGASPPVMNVEASCCATTPTRPASFGAVKSIYR